MEYEKQLFSLKSEKITIDIRLGWQGQSLHLNGYDLGETVTQLKGQSSYEYAISVKESDLEKLYRLNEVEPGQKMQLVEALAAKINGNQSYSLFRTYLTENGVRFESWVD